MRVVMFIESAIAPIELGEDFILHGLTLSDTNGTVFNLERAQDKRGSTYEGIEGKMFTFEKYSIFMHDNTKERLSKYIIDNQQKVIGNLLKSVENDDFNHRYLSNLIGLD
jgi:hypothetical protein